MALGADALPEGTHIVVDMDGRYRWRGTIDLRSNPTMAILVAKIMGGIVGGLFLLGIAMTLMMDGEMSRRMEVLGIFAGICLLVAGLGV